jgi:hypothetical protein
MVRRMILSQISMSTTCGEQYWTATPAVLIHPMGRGLACSNFDGILIAFKQKASSRGGPRLGEFPRGARPLLKWWSEVMNTGRSDKFNGVLVQPRMVARSPI